jgi:hypothetical protein
LENYKRDGKIIKKWNVRMGGGEKWFSFDSSGYKPSGSTRDLFT